MWINDPLVKRWNQLAADFANEPAVLIPVTIANGASLSSVGALKLKIVGFALPAAYTKSHLTFQLSWDGDTFYEMLDTGRMDPTTKFIDADNDPQSLGTKNYTLVHYGQAGYAFITGAAYFARAQYLKIRSGTPESPTNQDDDRIINIITMSHGASMQY